MTLPEWTESVSGLIGKLTAVPIRVSKRAKLTAGYLSVNFANAVAQLCKLGIATPMNELSESKLQRIKSLDVSDAAKAHAEVLHKRAETENLLADAEVKLSVARKNDTESWAMRAQIELARIESERRIADEKRRVAEDRIALAEAKLEAERGKLYVDPPSVADTGAAPESQHPSE